MPLADIASLASAAQNAAIAIAVVVGGTWTLYTFIRLGSVRKAKAELQKLQLDLAQQAVVSIDVTAEQMARYRGDGFVLCGAATVVNKGNRNTLIDFSADDSWTVTRIDFNKHGQPVDGGTIELPTEMTYYLRAGATVRFPFVARVEASGVYRVNVRSPVYQAEAAQAAADKGSEEADGYVWEGIGFVAVSDLPHKEGSAV